MTAKTRGDVEPASVDDVEGHDVVVAALDPRDRGVRHVQRPLVGREGQAVRVDQVVGRDRQLAGRAVEPEDEAATQLGVGLVALAVVEDPVRRIGEPDRAVGGDDDVVRRVEPPALEPVDDGRARAVGLVARDAPRARARRRGPARRGRACGRWRNRTGGRSRSTPSAADQRRTTLRRHVAPDDGVLVGHVDGPLGPDRRRRRARRVRRRPGRAARSAGRARPARPDAAPSSRRGGSVVGPRRRRRRLRCSARWSPRSSAILSSTSTTIAAAGAPVTRSAIAPKMIVTCRTTRRPYGANICWVAVVRRYSPRPM